MKKTLAILLTLLSYISFSQESHILAKNKLNNINTVDSNDLRCISKLSKNNFTIIYTFGIWCSPCKLHLKNAISLKDEYDVNLLILLIEPETEEIIQQTIDYLLNIDSDLQIVLLKDKYGNKRNRKYKKFLKEITPEDFENLNGMSKYIVFDNKGGIIMVTNWKDNRKYDWQDDSNMIKNKIIPLLEFK